MESRTSTAVPAAIRQFRDRANPASTPSDDLLSACREGDREPLPVSSIFSRPGLRGGNRIPGDRAAAADVSQEVFMKLLTGLPQFDGRARSRHGCIASPSTLPLIAMRVRRRSVPLPETLEDGGGSRTTTRAANSAGVWSVPCRRCRPKLRAPLVLRHVEALRMARLPPFLASRLARSPHACRVRTHAWLASWQERCDVGHVFDDLAAYAENQLAEKRHADVERHLTGCAECRESLARVREGIALASQLTSEPMPADCRGPHPLGAAIRSPAGKRQDRCHRPPAVACRRGRSPRSRRHRPILASQSPLDRTAAGDRRGKNLRAGRARAAR